MKPTELLVELFQRGVKLWVEDDQLCIKAPKGVLTGELRDSLVEHKPEILALLQKSLNANTANQTILPISRDADQPLSLAQQRLRSLDLLLPDTSVYNLPLAFRLTGVLDVAAMEKSVEEIARRHEILRTTFPRVDRKPVQKISPATTFHLSVIDLQNLPQNQREVEAQRLASQEAQQPFNLAEGPLWRVKLLRLAEDEHWLLVTLHHIVADGWSLTLFLRELSAHYKASPLPELPIQYADFASWHRQWLESEAIKSQLDYWQQHLGDSIAPLHLPADRPASIIQTYRGAIQRLVLSKNLTDDLKSLSQREGVSLFVTLLMAFKTLLNRYTGQEDIVVCSPVLGRNQSEIENLIGYFNNILPLRTDLSGNPSFQDLLRRGSQVTTAAYEHQDLPFQELADLVRPPLNRAIVGLQKAPDLVLDLPGITASRLDVHRGMVDFDLSLFVEENGDILTVVMEYKTDLFDGNTIGKMLDNYQNLLEKLMAYPQQQISSIPRLKATQNERLIDENGVSDSCNIAQKPTFVAPRNGLEIQLTKIWEKVLGSQPIGIRDNFFSDLGGTSLVAVKLFAEIEKAFNKNLPLSTLLQAPTVEQFANLISQEEWSGSWSSLAPIQTGGSKPPLFCIHAVGGNVLTYVALARHLGSDQPVYGIQAEGIDGKGTFHNSLEEMADHYIKAIRTVQPEGPYFLGGLSGGGIIAFEMSQQLVAQGEKVALLALFDSYNPEYLRARCIADDKYRTENFSITRSILERLGWYWQLQNQLKRGLRVLSHFSELSPQEKSSYLLEQTNKFKQKTQHQLELIAYKLDPRPGRSLPYLMREAAITNTYNKVVFSYTPKVYPGKVTLFRASESVFISSEGGDSDELGWDKVAAGGLEIHKVPGDHASLVAEPNVRVLAAKLKACIDRCVNPAHQSSCLI
jgi:thioesterase domain-containing protein/acyl carrier protein